LQKEYKELTLERLKKIYGEDFDYKEYLNIDDDYEDNNNNNDDVLNDTNKEKYVVNSLKNLYINVLVESNQESTATLEDPNIKSNLVTM